MSEGRWVFEVGERVRVEAATSAGDIVVSAGEAGIVEVDLDNPTNFTVEQLGDLITIEPQKGFFRRFGGSDLHLTVPERTTLSLSGVSGDVTVNTATTELEVAITSGDVRLGTVERLKVRSASGDVFVDDVTDRVEVITASGEVRIGSVGRDLLVKSASGDIWVDRVGESAHLKSASGDITLHRFDGTDLQLKTLSGNLRIGVPSRRVLDVDLQTLSGALRNRLPEGDGSEPERTVTLHIKTVSGDVTLEGA